MPLHFLTDRMNCIGSSSVAQSDSLGDGEGDGDDDDDDDKGLS